MFTKVTSNSAFSAGEKSPVAPAERGREVEREVDHSGREQNLANAVKNFDGVSVSSVASMVEGLATIGCYTRLPIVLVQTAESYQTVVLEQGSFQSLARKVVPATTIEDPVNKILSGHGTATQTVDLISSTLLRAQRGAILIDKSFLPDTSYATAKDEIRRIFSAGFYEVRDLLDARDANRADARELAKQSAFSRGGLEEQRLFTQGYGIDAQELREDLDTGDRMLLPVLSAKVQQLHDALRAINPALPWG